MEHDINHIFIFAIPLIMVLLYLVFKNLLLITTIVIFLVGIFTINIYNNRNRKEHLNIIKDKNRLYFFLSDDEMFFITLSKDESLSELLPNIIKKEMTTIELMVDRIDFINFRDDKLNKELNSLIPKPTS